jgi:hypothetical protein
MNNSSNTGFNEIQLDAKNSSGSGSSDMTFYVLDSLFSAQNQTNYGDYVYLYSQFGHPPGAYDSSGGYEEWGVANPALVPEPAPIALALSGLVTLGLGGLRRARRKATTA